MCIILYCYFPIASLVDYITEITKVAIFSKHYYQLLNIFLFLSLSLSLSLFQVRAGGEDAERVVHENQLDIVRLLVSHGADLGVTDEAGMCTTCTNVVFIARIPIIL